MKVVELVYYMRGSIQYDDMMFRTPGERSQVEAFIERRLEEQKNNPHPVY